MIYAMLSLWIISAIMVVRASKIVQIIIYLGIFSALCAVCFMMFGAPDVAMAEAAVSSFSTIFLIICFEKYFSLVKHETEESKKNKLALTLKSHVLPLCFTLFLIALFVLSIPDIAVNTNVKDKYLEGFMDVVGGENAVTAIYLGYRMYDTLFEALMLLVSVVGVAHMSWYCYTETTDKQISGVSKSDKVAVYTIRLVCPAMLLFGIYIILNGHLTPGGGFQGGVALAAFFICRYLIYNISDIRFGTIMVMEKLTYAGIIILAALFITQGLHAHFPEMRSAYLMLMNTLLGMKVAFGFTIILYRYVAFERM